MNSIKTKKKKIFTRVDSLGVLGYETMFGFDNNFADLIGS